MAVTPVLAFQWVGDLTPGSKYGVPGRGGRAQLAAARPLLTAADLTEANLEGTYSRGGRSKCGGGGGGDCFAFQAPPGNAPALRWAGIDAVNVANNHAFDFGAAGQAQTLAALRGAQVQWTGRPGQVTVLEVNGVKVALLGFAPYPWASSLLDIGKARKLIAGAARRAGIVIVAIHAGAEGADKDHVPHGHEHAFGEDRGNARAFAHAAIDAGADLVVGSGPARHPRRRALPRAPDRVLAGQLRRLAQLRHGRAAVAERDPARAARGRRHPGRRHVDQHEADRPGNSYAGPEQCVGALGGGAE